MKKTLIVLSVLSIFLVSITMPMVLDTSGSDTQSNDTETTTLDFYGNPDDAIKRLNKYKTGNEESTWEEGLSKYCLTLNGVNFKSSADYGISFYSNTEITVNGVNTITLDGPSTLTAIKNTLYNTYIKGNGTLNIVIKNSNLPDSVQAIRTTKLIISEGVTVNITCTGTGMFASSSVTIDGSTLKISGGNTAIETNGAVDCSYSILDVKGSNVAISANEVIFEEVKVKTSTSTSSEPKDEFDQTKLSTYKWIKTTQYGNITVKFDSNGGKGTMEDLHVRSGSITLPECGFTKDGCKFKCWRNGTLDYKPGDKVNVSSNTTFTAMWESDGSSSINWIGIAIIIAIIVALAACIGYWYYKSKT